MITLLNTSILTVFGKYEYVPATLCDVQSFVRGSDFQSAIGHQATADILTELLGVPVPVNRINYTQEVHDIAVVFKLRGRAPEGVIFDRAQVEEIGYDFGFLTRTQ